MLERITVHKKDDGYYTVAQDWLTSPCILERELEQFISEGNTLMIRAHLQSLENAPAWERVSSSGNLSPNFPHEKARQKWIDLGMPTPCKFYVNTY